MQKPDIITFADMNIDLIVSGEDVNPKFGQAEKLADGYNVDVGGSGAIFSCQSAKLGLTMAPIGSVGADSFGGIVMNTLGSAGVDTRYVDRDEAVPTGLTVILNNYGDRAMLTVPGTSNVVTREQAESAITLGARHLHICSFFLLSKIRPHVPELARMAKEKGMTISLDTNWNMDEPTWEGVDELLKYVDLFIPNENELLAIAGSSDFNEAAKIISSRVSALIVKRGAKGATFFGDTTFDVPAPEFGKRQDTVGAGDSFDAGAVFGYLSGWDWERCVRAGAICGSLNVAHKGGLVGQPKHEKLVSLLDNWDKNLFAE